jgi:hypothetical protein
VGEMGVGWRQSVRPRETGEVDSARCERKARLGLECGGGLYSIVSESLLLL